MIVKNKMMATVLGILIIAVVLINSRSIIRVEASEIDAPVIGADTDTDTEAGSEENQSSIIYENNVVGIDGSTTSTVEMSETYDKTYKLYEESIDNEFFLYSNVKNGGISSDPVSIDIPSNVSYTAEDDGKQMDYTSGDPIKQLGNYVFRITAVSGTTTYLTTFRFSIREAIVQADETDNANSDAPVKDPDTVQEPKTTDVTQTQDSDDLAQAVTGDDSSKDQTDQKTEVALSDEETTAALEDNTVDASRYTGLHEAYDKSTGDYVETLLSGEEFRTNYPNGIITNSEVVLNIPNTMEYTVYKNDEEYEVDAMQFSEAGSYRISMQSGKSKINYAFRIVGDTVSDMHIFNAPVGFALSEVYYEDNEVFAANRMQGSYYAMTEDGSYAFDFINSDTGVSYTTNVELDTQAPEVSVYIKNGTASITYNSSDIKSAEVLKDNVKLTGFSGNEISGKGNYTLIVADGAGNKTTISFALKNGINSATIWSLIIFVAIILGIVSMIRRNQKKLIVR